MPRKPKPVPTQPVPEPTPIPAPAPSTGFLTRSGQTLLLDGKPFTMRGFNVYHANGRNNCWQPPLGFDDNRLDLELDAMGSINTIRAWFFQGLAVRNGVRDWAAFDHTLAVCARRGIRVVVVIGGEDTCGETIHKLEDWYQTGYRTQVSPGHTVPYRAWVSEIVTRYRDRPEVGVWQIANEIEIKRTDGSCGSATTALNFGTDISNLIRSLDPKHLISLGTIGSGQCGSSGGDFKTIHTPPNIDLVELHYYPSPTQLPLPSFYGDQWNGMNLRVQQAKELNKPLFIGEMGLRLNTSFGGNKQARADALRRIVTDHRAAGIVGHLPWAWCSASESPYEDYLYQPGDPAIGALA